MGRHRFGEDNLKRVDIWLDERQMETIEYARQIYGGTRATIVRMALLALRRQLKMDDWNFAAGSGARAHREAPKAS